MGEDSLRQPGEESSFCLSSDHDETTELQPLLCSLPLVLQPWGLPSHLIQLFVLQVGAIRGSYLALEHMSKLSGGRGGVIVNTASMAGEVEKSGICCSPVMLFNLLIKSSTVAVQCRSCQLKLHKVYVS